MILAPSCPLVPFHPAGGNGTLLYALCDRFECPFVFEVVLSPTCQVPHFAFAALAPQPAGYEFLSLVYSSSTQLREQDQSPIWSPISYFYHPLSLTTPLLLSREEEPWTLLKVPGSIVISFKIILLLNGDQFFGL